MRAYIAYCGLDCEACEARIATANHDDMLRRKIAREWSELNGVKITPEMINCVENRTAFKDCLGMARAGTPGLRIATDSRWW